MVGSAFIVFHLANWYGSGVAMPLKQAFFAALIGLLAKNDTSLTSDVADCITFRLNSSIESGDQRTVRMYFLFLASLVEVKPDNNDHLRRSLNVHQLHVFTAEDLIANLIALVQLAISAGPGSCQGDWAVYAAISVLARSNHCTIITSALICWSN
jgi:hypothetical protein